MLELNKLYNMDCMIGMKQFPNKYFELAIVDPPYGINAPNMSMGSNKNPTAKNHYHSISTAERLRKGRLNQGAGKLKDRALQNMNCDWDYEKPSPEYFKELFRISQNQIIFGGNYFDLPPTRGIGCWDKCQPWENFSQWEMIWTSYDCPAFIIRYSNTGGANKEEKIHPCQKPVPVYNKLLAKFGKRGYRIIDTHAGSASSLVSAFRGGYSFIGFETDEEYHRKANKRLEIETAQISLFERM